MNDLILTHITICIMKEQEKDELYKLFREQYLS